MSGTDVVYGVSYADLSVPHPPLSRLVLGYPIWLHRCYAMSGTDIACGATGKLSHRKSFLVACPLWFYACGMRCPVLTNIAANRMGGSSAMRGPLSLPPLLP
eukprot:484046-Rhodomonas_salina.4